MKDKYCVLCGKPAECKHHLIFGWGMRELAEEDHLTIDLCNQCHNMGPVAERIHGNPMAERLSKTLGQAIWERDMIAKMDSQLNQNEKNAAVRDEFIKRYGRSWL